MAPDPLLHRLFRLEKKGSHWGLAGIRALLDGCGRPERAYPALLVGGTNGKGSAAATLERILREAGYRTGLYTSPHLVKFHERIRVNGRAISGPRLRGLLLRFLPLAARRRSTFFECATAMALRHFADCGVEFAVLEVGLGGRLDCTNVVHPEVSVITGISMDHMDVLGDTLPGIAREKAGISRRGRAVITGGRGRARMLVEAACRARGARVVRAQRAAGLVRVSLTPGHMSLREDSGAHYRTALVGDHQVSNLECAVAAARELRGRGFEISEPAIRCGLREVRWPARFEWLARRGVLLDVAHNPEAARCFARTYGATFRRPGVGVVGMLADKDAPGVARQLRACARLWVATAPEAERALSPEGMARALGRAPHVVVPGVARALKRALQERRRGEPVIVIGSLYTVGEAMARLGAHGQSRL